ncbi:hypothetical protein P2318_30240 [Myxococcaceae bacterium GXIMD 01537]
MRTHRKQTAGWRRLALLAVGTLPLALLGAGCNPECTDVYDCRNSQGAAPQGKTYTCREQRCELVPAGDPGTEVPSDAGTDGGTTPTGDGGSDVSNDGGVNDGGTEPTADGGVTDGGTEPPVDGGVADGGTEPPVDGGVEPPVDGGIADGGTEPPVDGGIADGGVEPPMDGGVADGGTEPPVDGGTDAGVVTCDNTPHDAKLGTLKLEPGFEAPESAQLPEGITAVTAMAKSGDYVLYGLRSADKSLYGLGTWPGVALGAEPLSSVVAPEDRASSVFLSGYVVNDGVRLLSGYTKSGAGFPGSALVFDTVEPARSNYVLAPGNYSAAGLDGAFLVNGGGLDTLSGDNAVYALRTSAQPPSPLKLASFASAWKASSGYTAVTADGIAVLGYFSGQDFLNHLLAVSPAGYGATLGGSGASVDLSGALDFYSGGDLFGVAGFGGGVALHRGSYDSTTWAQVTSDVSRVSLSTSGSGGSSVTAGALATVLVAQDRCTEVVLLAPMGHDLLVGISDKNGRRLVRLHKP